MASATARTPNDLDLVIDFVNTLDPDDGTDALATPEGLQQWLVERELLEDGGPKLAASDQRVAIRLREALRALMLENNGEAADSGAAEELERDRPARAARGALRR